VNLNTIFRGPATIDPPRLTLVTAPAVEPWTSTDAEVQQALRLDSDADSNYVNLVLKAARRYFEQVTGLCLITQTWKVSNDDIPVRQGQFGLEYGLAPSMSRFTGAAAGREIRFARAPLQSVDSFIYLDETGTSQTFAPSNYTVGSVGVETTFGRLWLNQDASWPSTGSFPGSIQITFTAGFGAAASSIPDDIRLALLYIAAHWYEHRLPVTGDGVSALPHHLDALIASHRIAFIA
jgi:hypothetical protein